MQYELSYWESESIFTGIDVAVIGSGIVGLTAAIHVKNREPRSRVVILERGPMPAGASTRNAGFACFGSMTELLDDLNIMPEEDVLATVEKRWTGLQRLRALVGDENMDFQQWGGYEMFTDQEEDIYQECLERMPYFNEKIGRITGHAEVYKCVDERLPEFGYKGVRHLILNQPEGQVHTGNLMRALVQIARNAGVEIFNGVGVERLEDSADGVDLSLSTGWDIHAPRVLVAVNGFARQLLPQLDLYPARNQVLVTEPVPGLRVSGCFHYDRGYIYFRNIDGRILLGGGRNLDFETEKTGEFGDNKMIRTALVRFLQEVICPNQEVPVERWWTGIMGLGPVKKPVVELVSPHVAVAVRLSGMGVAIGTLVGQEGAELLTK